jgi:hypothetical protein
MSDTEEREIAQGFFEQKQEREHLKDAIKQEEVRRTMLDFETRKKQRRPPTETASMR